MNSTLGQDLENRLKEAGLPINPVDILGRAYQFERESVSHNHILVGTVTAIELSDEGDLDIYVTSPRFWGVPLISIKYWNGTCGAFIASETPNDRFFTGKFKLL